MVLTVEVTTDLHVIWNEIMYNNAVAKEILVSHTIGKYLQRSHFYNCTVQLNHLSQGVDEAKVVQYVDSWYY